MCESVSENVNVGECGCQCASECEVCKGECECMCMPMCVMYLGQWQGHRKRCGMSTAPVSLFCHRLELGSNPEYGLHSQCTQER